MTGRPRLSKIDLRSRRNALYLAILREALLLLDLRGSHIEEVALNKALFQCILEVIRRRHASGRPTVDVPPVFDGPNPPLLPHPAPEERKRPDLRFDLMDHSGPDLATSVVSFAIECKRLGSAIGTRVLNTLYVSNGVVRFIHQDWAYGRNAVCGVMVGYVQSLDFTKIQDEVNTEVRGVGVPELAVRGAGNAPLFESGHFLVRTFPRSPYELVHLWIDLR